MKPNRFIRQKQRQHCWTGKVRFRKESQALQELARIQEIAEYAVMDKVPVRAYSCSSCDGWHLTSQPEGTWIAQ
jgi:hypothetical protein